MPIVAAGSPITLYAQYQDGTGTAVVPDTPLVSILNPFGVEAIHEAVPTFTGQIGRYSYVYPVDSAGPIGSWTARWSGVINGSGIEQSEVFAVVEAGDIVFPGAGGVIWATLDDVDCGPCAEYGPDPSPWFGIASETLYNLTERAYPGVRTDVIRPPSTCGCGWWLGVDWSQIAVGSLGWSGARYGCRCAGVSEIVLPGWPAREVSQVLVDGVAVDPTRYRIDQHQRLVYMPDLTTGGAQARRSWPSFQRVDQPATEANTWQVTYTYGTDPPAGGRRAAAIYACEIALACEGDDRCRLPSNTVTVSAKNVSKVIADPEKIRAAGETGIPEVDAWIRADRWGRQHRGGAVLAGRSQPRHTRRTSS